MEPLGSNLRIVVGFAAEEFGVFASLRAKHTGELSSHHLRALIVVGDDLCLGNTVRLNLTIDQETRDPRPGGTADRSDRSVSPGVVKDNGNRVGGDRGIDQIILPVSIVIVGIDADPVAQGPGTRGSGVCFRFEDRIVLRGDDDGHERLV